ncbi:uncharacterized protein A4U43_C08F27650 [Asparagus officinalis]|nr:uncharacterized protein A4U43_C08F27650 [Asparagus officinalis]
MTSATVMSETDHEMGEEIKKPIFRDIRRYYCEYCGICRSKKSLIRSHVLTYHKDQIKQAEADDNNSETNKGKKVWYTCKECDASFRKPAYLKQHMQGHSLEVIGF